MMRGIVWFRRDLRLRDNPALTAACGECEEIIPLFVFDEPLLRSRVFGSACANFMLGCLQELASSLADRGASLEWRLGEQVEEIIRAARDWRADVVYWNRDYEPVAIKRDRVVQQRLSQMGVAVRTFKDHVVFEADEVRGAAGEPMQRYSAYRTRWWTKWHAVNPVALPVPNTISSGKVPSPSASRPLPSARDLGYDSMTPGLNRVNEAPGSGCAGFWMVPFTGMPTAAIAWRSMGLRNCLRTFVLARSRRARRFIPL
jgi:deoxyribodipyrimidine photo-lyase